MRWLASAVAVVLFASCGSDSNEDALRANERRWASRRPAAYTYTFTTRGFAPHVELQVTVRDAAVSSTIIVGSQLGTGDGQTIEQLFDDVRRRLRLDADCRVTVSYDETLGYPADVYSDCGGEGDGWKVTELTALEMTLRRP